MSNKALAAVVAAALATGGGVAVIASSGGDDGGSNGTEEVHMLGNGRSHTGPMPDGEHMMDGGRQMNGESMGDDGMTGMGE